MHTNCWGNTMLWMTYSKKTLPILLLSLLTSGVTYAKRSNYYEFDEIKDSPFTVMVDLETGYNNNLTRERNSNDAISSSFVNVIPGFAYTYKPSASRYSVLYRIDSGHYFDSKDDNYTDHYFESNNLISFNIRNNVSLIYTYNKSHEERGTGLTEGALENITTNQPVKFTDHNVNAEYIYGANTAKGQLRFGLGYQDKSYTNYQQYEIDGNQFGSQFSNFSAVKYSTAFWYLLGRSTQLSLSAQRNDKQYQYTNQESRDNTDDFYSLGARWDLSDKSKGEAFIGLQNKSFKSNQKTDFSGLSYRVKGQWLPQRHTAFTLNASLIAEDPDQFGDYVNETIIKLDWTQDWFERFSTTASIGWENDDFTADSPIGSREDDTYLYTLDFNYQFSRIINFGFYLSSEDKDSNWLTYRYKQQLVGLYTKIEL
ncbi:hypothetical protein A1QK_02285 [Vibrio genomosp. F10 str. 9ZD137]|nr:hypothetical protein A1QK_02285 [Vibrio genomosp. F10 str. 9ZD137]